MSVDPDHKFPAPNEIDVNGHPVYRFPPFPKPPPGVTIIPFKDFKPSGIQRPALGFPDDIELDGLGIPTCSLPTKPDVDGHVVGGAGKKKKKKSKKRGGVGGGVVQNGRRLPWWEEWAIDEQSRGVRELDLLASLN